MDTKTQSAYQEELQRLEETNIEIDKQLARLRTTPVYYGPDLTEQALEVARENGRHNLAKAVDEPYFGRLDFQESGTASSQPLYIGKSGVEDERTANCLLLTGVHRLPAYSTHSLVDLMLLPTTPRTVSSKVSSI